MQHLRTGDFSLLVIEHCLPWGGGDGAVEVMLTDECIETVPVVLLDNPPINVAVDGKLADMKLVAASQLVHAVRQRLR